MIINKYKTIAISIFFLSIYASTIAYDKYILDTQVTYAKVLSTGQVISMAYQCEFGVVQKYLRTPRGLDGKTMACTTIKMTRRGFNSSNKVPLL